MTTYAEAAVSVSGFYMKTPGAFAIELKSEKKCIGAIDLRVDADNDKAGFGYVLNRAYWNSGYMSEALSALIDFAFNTLEVNRVESTHYTDNPASGKVMEKCGMKREGMSPQEVKVKGTFRDVVHYGILRGH